MRYSNGCRKQKPYMPITLFWPCMPCMDAKFTPEAHELFVNWHTAEADPAPVNGTYNLAPTTTPGYRIVRQQLKPPPIQLSQSEVVTDPQRTRGKPSWPPGTDNFKTDRRTRNREVSYE